MLSYIHIGKTAGTTFKNVVNNYSILKKEIVYHQHSFKPYNSKCEKQIIFCIRDPIARFISAFNHRKTKLERQRKTGFDATWSKREKFEVDNKFFETNTKNRSRALRHIRAG